MAVLDTDLAVRDQGVVGVDLERLVLGGVELDDSAATHAEQVVNRHRGRA